VKRLSTGVLLMVVAAMLGLAATACGGNNARSESSASQSSIDELAARVQQNQMLNAAITISGLPIHEMDTAAQGGKIDNKYVPTARMLVRVTALTDWVPDLAGDATKMHGDGVALLKALDAGKDIDAIKPLSQAVHEDWHTFTDKVWNVVAKSLPADEGGPRPESTAGASASPMSHDMTMPAGDATAAGH
jgi:hypothetical protein